MEFTTLKEGSTITQWKELAEAFSHKPTLTNRPLKVRLISKLPIV